MKWIEAAKEGQGYVLSAELKELGDYLALNEKECGTYDDGSGDEAAVAETKE